MYTPTPASYVPPAHYHFLAISVITLSLNSSAFQLILVFLNNGSKDRSRDADNLDIVLKSHEVLPLSEMVKIHDLIWKKKLSAEVAKIQEKLLLISSSASLINLS